MTGLSANTALKARGNKEDPKISFIASYDVGEGALKRAICF